MNDDIIKKAGAFAADRDVKHLVGLTPAAIDDTLIAYSKAHALDGEHDVDALSRLCASDDTAIALAKASYWASAQLSMALTATNAQGSSPGSRRAIAKAMDDVVKDEQREGESYVDAYSRLLDTDVEFQGAYAKYCEAE